jgi:tartrate-resistant acid phosphatase type 5
VARLHIGKPAALLGAAAVVLSLGTCLVAPKQEERRRPHPLDAAPRVDAGAGAVDAGTVFATICAPETHPAAPGERLATRFVVIGDYGNASAGEQSVAALVDGWDPDFILTTGDNNYPSGAGDTIDVNIGQFFHRFIASYTGRFGCGAAANRFFPALGNHDLDTAAGQPYLDYFHLPGNERYYDFVQGDVQLFAIDSDPREPDGIAADSVQAAWLKQRLASSTARWQVVYMHHPPYSSGPHGSTPPLQWPYAAWGADLVLAGHDHDYERIQADGITYVVNGVGGAESYAIGTLIPGSVASYTGGFGALLVDADATRMHVRFYGTAGNPIDDFQLGQ